MNSLRGIATKAGSDSFMATTYARPPIVLSRGKGLRVWDTTGKPYLDFTAGIAVTGLGHSDEQIADIMNDQARTLVHCSNLYMNEWTPRLSESLVTKTKESGAMADASRVFVCNSGSEANEAALKFSRRYASQQSPNKTDILSFNGSFHGRTYGALSATPTPKYQKPFLPMVPGFSYADLNSKSALEHITNNTAAVIVEPVQGEGGIHPANLEWLASVRQKCNETGSLLIYDEIQCGLGRTGDLWAHAAFGPDAQPDILTMAKALGNGYPIGATMITERVNNSLSIGDHGTTYGGNPLACRVGLHVLERICDPRLLENVRARSSQIVKRAQKWAADGLIEEVRGRGLILGLQLKDKPDALVSYAREKGLLVITAGSNTLRLVPALTISESEADEGLAIIEKGLQSGI